MTEKPTSVERLLLDHVERLERNRAGRRAVVMRLSRLRPTNRGARQLRIAANTFETLVKQFDGQMFVLQQGDIIFICKYENAAATDAAVTKVRYLFDDDPLTAQLFTDSDGFATWFDLDTDFTRFRALVDETVREDEAGRKRTRGDRPGRHGRAPTDGSFLAQRTHQRHRDGGRVEISCVARRSVPSFLAKCRSRSCASSTSRSPICATPSCRAATFTPTAGCSST